MTVSCSRFPIVVTAVFVGPARVRKNEAGYQQEREQNDFLHGGLTKTFPRSAWAQSSAHPSMWLLDSLLASLTCACGTAYPPNG